MAESPYLLSHQLGNQIDAETQFQPMLDDQQTQQMINQYQAAPNTFTPQDIENLKKHAYYHQKPMYEGEFTIGEAIKQFGQGVFSGFTTFNVGKAPDNEYEAISRSIGHLIGFAPGMVAKPLQKIKILEGFAKKLSGVKSVPMFAAEKIRQQAVKLTNPLVRASVDAKYDAVKTVGGFLNKKKIKHITEGAFDLGVASGLSAWQGGINEMLNATFHGAAAGAVFRGLGNYVNMGDEKATKLTRALAGSLYMGLQAEQRGATTPEKVYEYLLGGFFGYGEAPYYRANAAKFMQKYQKERVSNAEMDVKATPELMGEKWTKLDKLEKKEVKRIIETDVLGGGKIEDREYMGDRLMEALGPEYTNAYGNITKEGWEVIRTAMRDKGPQPTELAPETLVEPAKERIVKEVSDLNIKLQKNKDDLGVIKKEIDIENRKFKSTGERNEALSTVYKNQSDQLTRDIIATQAKLEKLTKGLDDVNLITQVEKNKDTYTDTGEKTTDVTVGRPAENFTEKWLNKLYDIDVDPQVKVDLKTLIAHKVDKELLKVARPQSGETPNIDKLVRNIQKQLPEANIGPEPRGELKQLLTRLNKGMPQRYMRVTFQPEIAPSLESKGQSEKIVFQPMYLESPITKGGNPKDNIEPIKVFEEIYLKESGGEIDANYGNLVHIDHISARNQAGQWKDYSLSNYRKDSPIEYKNVIQRIVESMHEQKFYLFGGRGDADKLYMFKYHPKTNKKIGNNLFRSTNMKTHKDYKEAYKLFKEQFPDIKETTLKKMFEDSIKSNILYDMGVQGFELTQANFNKMWKSTKGEFLSNTLAYNKRLQIPLTPAWPGSKELADSIFKNDKAYNTKDNEGNTGFKAALVKDVDLPPAHKEKLMTLLAEHYTEATDGAIIGRRGVINYNNEDAGMPRSGQNKAFIINPNKEYGALYGKFMFHKAGKKLSELMDKAGVHYLIHESSAKQIGTREIGTYTITPKGELKIDAPIYNIDPRHIKYNYSVKQGKDMYEHKARIPKQWFGFLNSKVNFAPVPKDVIQDIFNETISKSYEGKTETNKLLAEYLDNPTPKKLNKIIKNIEDIGVPELLNAINRNEGTKFADAAYEKLMKLTKEMAAEEARESGKREIELQEYNTELDEFHSVTNRMLKRAHKIAKGKDLKASTIYAHKWVRNYRLNVMRNYLMGQIAKPSIGNSAATRMRPYDKALRMDLDNANPALKELNNRDDIFFLDNDYRNLPIKTHLKNWEKTTLGELWDAYNDKQIKKQFEGKEAQVDEIFRAMVVRVPMDSISGAHALKFKGFTGINGHGILTHPRTMRALGGADLDGDEAFVYFGGKNARNEGSGMKKEWKDAFEANKEEYVAYVSKDPIKEVFNKRTKKKEPVYDYLTREEYDALGKKQDKYAKFIPDPKTGFANRPDNLYPKDLTMEDLLTKSADSNVMLAKKSKIAMYTPSMRLNVSENVVNSRQLMGSIVSMTQNLKNAHDLVSNQKNGKDTFDIKVKESGDSGSVDYTITIKARTDKKWLDYARRLSSSMTAFTADPMDTGGTRPYDFYFRELYDSYFKIDKVARVGRDLKIDNMRKFDNHFESVQGAFSTSPNIYKLNKGVVHNVAEMNRALFSKNYRQGAVWSEKEIRDKLEFVKDMDPKLLTTTTAKQGKLLANAPRWTDDIFSKMSETKVINLYKEINTLAKNNKALAGLMGRTTFTIPESIYVLKALKNNLHDPSIRHLFTQSNADSQAKFDAVLNKLGYKRSKEESAKELIEKSKDLTPEEKAEILEDIYHQAQDYMVNDIHDMITLKRVSSLYEANKETLTLKKLRDIFNKVERTKMSSATMMKNRNDTGSFYENMQNMDLNAQKQYKEMVAFEIEQGIRKPFKGSAELDQVQLDKRMKAYKENLSPVEKDLYDYLMLGTYNRNEMALRGKVNLNDPEIKKEFIKAGAKTSLTQVGWNSKSVSVKNVDRFIKDYMDISAKTFTENKTDLKRALEFNKKLEEVDIPVKDVGNVKLFEKKSPEVEVKGYEEDLSGYIGLKKGALNPKQKKVVDELAENLKYYSNGVTLKLNDITRGLLRKDLNAMDYQDYTILNNIFKDHRNGTFAQRLFKESSPEMKRRFWMLFPDKISKSMMKYDITFMKSKGAFKTADGKWVEGWLRRPSWVLEGLMDWNGKLRDRAVDLGEQLQIELNSTLNFYVDAMPEGRKLRRIAVSEMELGQINRILYGRPLEESTGGTEKSMELRQQDADSYRKNYLREIQGSTKNIETAKPTGEAKQTLEKTYNMTTPEGKREKMTGYDIVKTVKDTYTSMNKRAHEIMKGDPKALQPYETGVYFDGKSKQEPKLNWRKFISDIEKLYQQGQPLPTNFGIDGLRQIARSMMLDFAPNKNLREKLMNTKLSKTGQLEYGSYYPHMFGSKRLANEALEKGLMAINKDSKMSKDQKHLERKKLLSRIHNLEGDFLDPNGDLYDAYDRAAQEILQSRKGRDEQIKWWDANQRMGSMNARNTHTPGWDIGRNTYEVYLRNIGNTYFNQMNQIFSRHMIEAFSQRMRDRKIGHNWDLEKTGYFRNDKGEKVQSTLLNNWVNFLKLYTSEAMGNPTIIPEKIYNDPAMKIKGTPYYWWADNRVKEKINRMKKTIFGEKTTKYPNIAKLVDQFDYNDLNKLSTIEAKFNLASLLAHPKSGVANLFGGSMHTVQSAGLEYFKKGRSLKYLQKLNPEFKTMADVDAHVTSQGVIPEFLLYQFGLDPKVRKANLKEFTKDVSKKINKSGELDELSFNDLIKKHKVTKPIMDAAAMFMSKPERILRRDAYMSHLIRGYEMFDGALKYDHPFLVELAKKGVKATQFLYSAPYRPAFSRSALGRVMTRFQLWQWNAVRFRNDIAKEAKLYGVQPGTPEYDKFVRMIQLDMFVFAMGNAFAYSIFDTAMPAPYAWYQDTADWLFGSEIERDRAFFGEYPTAIAPLKLVTPPGLRHPIAITKAMYSGDWERFAHYHAYTMFPFGRIAKDISPFAKNNLIENPMSLVDKFTGFPLQKLSTESKKMRKGVGAWYPWNPHGSEREVDL